MTPPGTVVISKWASWLRGTEILIALKELEGSPEVGPHAEGGWIVLGQRGIEFLENGAGIYVEEFWEELP